MTLSEEKELLQPERTLSALVSADLDRDDQARLRRRIEDLLRKSPAALYRVAGQLAAAGEIRIDDLV